ncbi:MAG: hypothetical protein WC775_05475 [Patescibacteria group bacterium]|jgi:hypothetical protein
MNSIERFVRRVTPQIGMGVAAESAHNFGLLSGVFTGMTGYGVLNALRSGATVASLSAKSLSYLIPPGVVEALPQGLSMDIFGFLGIAAAATATLLAGGYQIGKFGFEKASPNEKELYKLSRLLVPIAYGMVFLAGVSPLVGLAASAASLGMQIAILRKRK